VHRAPTKAFADEVPYPLVLVRIPEGALVEARVDDPSGNSEMWTVGQPALLRMGAVNGTALPVARVIE